MRRALPALCVMMAVGCLPPSPKGPAPVDGMPVQVFAIDIVPNKAATVYIRNDSREEMTLTSFALIDCTNVRQECKEYTPNLVVPVGKSVEVMRVEAANTLLRYRYRYTYETRSARGGSSGGAIGTSVKMITSNVRISMLSNPEKFVARVPVNDSAVGRCRPRQPAFNGPGRTLLMMEFPGATRAERRSLYVELDADGTPTIYNDNRGDNSQPAGMERSDTMPPRTTISIQLKQGTAMLINEGGGKKPQHYMTTSRRLMTAKSLGNPQAMLNRVMLECGTAP